MCHEHHKVGCDCSNSVLWEHVLVPSSIFGEVLVAFGTRLACPGHYQAPHATRSLLGKTECAVFYNSVSKEVFVMSRGMFLEVLRMFLCLLIFGMSIFVMSIL